MTKNAHLATNALNILDASDEERIEYICSPQWIGYPLADKAIARFEYLYGHPQTHRMPNALLVGETNNGKTMIARRFVELVRRRAKADPDRIHMPVLMISAPSTGEGSHFYASILRQLGAPYKERAHVSEKEFQVICLLRELRVKTLIIDEIHEVVQGGPRKQRNLLNIIKTLTNETQIPLVGLGTFDALRAVQADPQLANRFRPITLRRWGEDMDYLRLLATFETLLPLKKKSNLPGKGISKRIFRMSEGLIGEISSILTEAACLAINRREERINDDILDILEWAPPSKRKAVF